MYSKQIVYLLGVHCCPCTGRIMAGMLKTQMNTNTQKSVQPIITRSQQTQRMGIFGYFISRYAVGYVLKGRKYIYYGDTRYEVKHGDLFYLGIGNHYVENVCEDGKPYEEITFYYSPEDLREAFTILSMNFQFELEDGNIPVVKVGDGLTHAVCPAWNVMKNFFNSVNQYLREDVFTDERAIEKLKAVELVYLILSHPDCAVRGHLLNDVNMASEGFEQIIRQHIFDGLSTEELAALCNKSLTSFKKEFVKHFHEPPHKWFLQRRLVHSRLLLVSTDKSIATIASECRFTNTSHYIKLFKQEYGITPAVYRNRQRGEVAELRIKEEELAMA